MHEVHFFELRSVERPTGDYHLVNKEHERWRLTEIATAESACRKWSINMLAEELAG